MCCSRTEFAWMRHNKFMCFVWICKWFLRQYYIYAYIYRWYNNCLSERKGIVLGFLCTLKTRNKYIYIHIIHMQMLQIRATNITEQRILTRGHFYYYYHIAWQWTIVSMAMDEIHWVHCVFTKVLTKNCKILLSDASVCLDWKIISFNLISLKNIRQNCQLPPQQMILRWGCNDSKDLV